MISDKLSVTLVMLLIPLGAFAGIFTATSSSASIREGASGEMLMELTDSVVVTNGEVVITSDAATIWELSERAVFSGNVNFESDTVSGHSDYLEFDAKDSILIIRGNVFLYDGETEVRAEEVVYYMDSEKATVKDSVVMTGEWLGTVSGQYAMYDFERNSMFITVDPLLIHTEDEDTMYVTADRLEFFSDENRAEAQGNAVVTIPEREIVAEAEYLYSYGDEDRIELFGSPELTTADGELSGDEIEVYMTEDGGISSVIIEGNATGFFSDTNDDPPSETWFTSQTADFFFVDEEMDLLYIAGSANLVYKAGGEAAEQQEINTVKSDIFIITFEDGSAVEVTAIGNVSGTYSYREDSGE